MSTGVPAGFAKCLWSKHQDFEVRCPRLSVALVRRSQRELPADVQRVLWMLIHGGVEDCLGARYVWRQSITFLQLFCNLSAYTLATRMKGGSNDLERGGSTSARALPGSAAGRVVNGWPCLPGGAEGRRCRAVLFVILTHGMLWRRCRHMDEQDGSQHGERIRPLVTICP